MNFDGRELDLRQRSDQRRIAAAKSRRVEDRRVKALVVRGVDLVDGLAFDIRMKNLDVETELGGIAANSLIVFGQGHRPENFELNLAAHVHSGTMDDQDFRHEVLLI